MRAVIPKQTIRPQALPRPTGPDHLQQFVAPLVDLASACGSIVADSIGTVPTSAGKLHIPRFVFLGPKGGDEKEGAEIVASLFHDLAENEDLAKGYHIFAYPLCNPWAFATGSRLNKAGEDLTQHFWCGSKQVEAYYLERELGVRQFHGVISLHIHDGEGFGYSLNGPPSSVLHEALAQSALAAIAAGHDPSVVFTPPSFLSNTDELRPLPFEINWSVPRSRVNAGVPFLLSMLDSYRAFMGWKLNI